MEICVFVLLFLFLYAVLPILVFLDQFFHPLCRLVTL